MSNMYWMRDFKDQQRSILMDREPSKLTRAARNLRDLLVRHRDRAVGGGMVLAAAAVLAVPMAAPEKSKLCLPEGTATDLRIEALSRLECDPPSAKTVRAGKTTQPQM